MASGPKLSDSKIFGLQFLAGAGAGVVAKTLTAPIERIKILLQVETMKCPSQLSAGSSWIRAPSLRVLRTICTEEGILGLFKGNWANVVRVMPMYAIKFGMNDTFKNFFRNPGQTTLTFKQLIASGTMAGIIQVLATYPLEMVRTRLALSSSWGVKEKNIFALMVEIRRKEGFWALYKGFSACFFTGTPCTAIQLALYEFLKNIKFFDTEFLTKHNILLQLAYGSTAGIISQSFTYWGDTIKRRMQSNGIGGSERYYKNSFDCAAKIFAKDGLKGFYRGYLVNVVRSVPGAAIQLTAYDQLKKFLIGEIIA